MGIINHSVPNQKKLYQKLLHAMRLQRLSSQRIHCGYQAIKAIFEEDLAEISASPQLFYRLAVIHETLECVEAAQDCISSDIATALGLNNPKKQAVTIN